MNTQEIRSREMKINKHIEKSVEEMVTNQRWEKAEEKGGQK